MSLWQSIFGRVVVWREYDAGIGKLWISDPETVDADIRRRSHGEFDQRTDKMRGLTDFQTKEMFCIEDPGVIAHEFHHLSLNSLAEGPVDPINNGVPPVEPPEPKALFEEPTP